MAGIASKDSKTELTVGELVDYLSTLPRNLPATVVSADGTTFLPVIAADWDGVDVEEGGHLELIMP